MEDELIYNLINQIKTSHDLVNVLKLLANDFKVNPKDWENTTVDEFIEAVAGYIEDSNHEQAFDQILWDNEKLSIVARLFYMGKIYE